MRYKWKKIIKLFLPPICFKLKRRFSRQNMVSSIPLEHNKQGERMIVIGNGPSLNKSIELYGDCIRRSECMMVNFSAATSLFEFIKPSVYVLVDPRWFDEELQNKESIKALVHSCINALVNKTQWPMTIVMPKIAKSSMVASMLQMNPFIQMQYFYNGWEIPHHMTKFEAWNQNLYCPPGQTVLTTCIWLSVYWGYKETYLIGADTTFLLEANVDQSNNAVYSTDKHFYNANDVYGNSAWFDKETKNRRYLNEPMTQLISEVKIMFDEYNLLNEYAKWKGVKIYNASEFSWIDVYERKKLK